MRRTAALFVLLPLLLAGSPATAGDDVDTLECHVVATLHLDPGISLQPSAGTIRTDEADDDVSNDAHCVGTVGGDAIDGAGSVSFDGTYGDGEVSKASGGATCTHNDGWMKLTIKLPGSPAFKGEAYWVRNAALVIDTAGTLRQAPLAGTGQVTNRYGSNCSGSTITKVDIELVLSATGDLSHPGDGAAGR